MGGMKDKTITSDRELWTAALISLRELHSYAFNNQNESDVNFWPMMQSASIVIEELKELLAEVKHDAPRAPEISGDGCGSRDA